MPWPRSPSGPASASSSRRASRRLCFRSRPGARCQPFVDDGDAQNLAFASCGHEHGTGHRTRAGAGQPPQDRAGHRPAHHREQPDPGRLRVIGGRGPPSKLDFCSATGASSAGAATISGAAAPLRPVGPHIQISGRPRQTAGSPSHRLDQKQPYSQGQLCIGCAASSVLCRGSFGVRERGGRNHHHVPL